MLNTLLILLTVLILIKLLVLVLILINIMAATINHILPIIIILNPVLFLLFLILISISHNFSTPIDVVLINSSKTVTNIIFISIIRPIILRRRCSDALSIGNLAFCSHIPRGI